MLGDTANALQPFAWFAQTFPDDGGDPAQYLCWILALYRAGDLKQAAAKLRQTMLANLYLQPRLLGLAQDPLDMWHPSNLTEKAYSDSVPDTLLMLWEPAALHWAHTVYHRAPMQRVRRRYIAIYHQLQTGARRAHTEPPGGRSLSTALPALAGIRAGYLTKTPRFVGQ